MVKVNDPREASTLAEAALNADGKTCDGAKALSWISEVLNPGKGLSEAEVKGIWEDTKARKKAGG